MKFIYKFFKFLFFLSVIGALAGIGGLAFIYHRLEPQLPSTETLKDVRLQVPLRIYSRDERLMAEYGEKRRIPLSYDQIPERVHQAFLSAEDDRFFQHPGVDYHALLRAAIQLALTGQRRQGGSTITMQVARNFFLSREKTYTRKLKEIFLALRIERELSKQEILELYLNKIYLGNRAYGIGAAAHVYYGRTVDELDLAQTAMLAGLPKAPSSSNPIANPERAIQRRAYVLGRMQQLGFITAQESEQAKETPVSARLHSTQVELRAPYVAEMVRAEVVRRYGEEAYTRGLNIYSSIDSRLQEAANSALRGAMQSYDKRHGYRGPAGQTEVAPDPSGDSLKTILADLPKVAGLERGVVVAVEKQSVDVLLRNGETRTIGWQGLKWARRYVEVNRRGPAPKQADAILAPGDLIYLLEETDKEGQPYLRLAQIPSVSGALVAIEPEDGTIGALIGGYDFYLSKFNRVTQARRQPGSGFKAFIYSAALEAGFTPASLINDAPLVIRNASKDGDWRPQNYSGKWFGLTRLRIGLYKSRNMISIRLLRAMGVDFALQHAARFGFDPDKLPANLTLALGSGEVTPLEMARGYAVLANGGFLVDPYFIDRIEEGGETLLYQATPLRVCHECPESSLQEAGEAEIVDEPVTERPPGDGPPAHAPRVLSAQNQYLMASMMKDVIRRGTGTRARSLGRSDLAGKTGTSNEQRDAWFSGFNPGLVAVAWVGFDSFAPLGRKEVGGRVALPAWITFMEEALEGVEERGWDMPDGIVTARIDPKSGKPAAAGAKNAVFEVFRKGNIGRPGASAASPVSAPAGSDDVQSSSLTQELF